MMQKLKKKVSTLTLILGLIASSLFNGMSGLSPGAWSTKDGNIAKAYAAAKFSAKLEAENAEMTGNVTAAATRAGYSGTGYATGFTQASGNSWSMQVTLPATRHYKFTIRTASDSYKENYLYIDGAQAATIYSTGDGTWQDTVIDGVYLKAGSVTLSIKEYWGWFDLDCITIEEGSSVPESVYSGAVSTLVNTDSNQKTKDIMTYLKSIYGKNTLSGQSCTLNANTEIESIHNYTGKYPALRLFDFIFCSPASSYQSSEEVNLALSWDKKGGLTSFQWHWHAPKGGASFYTKDTSFDLSKAVTSYDISKKSLTEVKSMYETGLISEECYLLVRDIDVISGYLNTLQQAGVTVLWRPLHEASGGWFWWGAKGADAYLWLYKLMFDRQTYYHHLNNLIWVWNGQSADWYPGDGYCDIAGSDIYADKHNYSVQTDQFLKTVNYSKGTKMTALTENGVMMDPDLMVRDNTYWLWFGVWYGDFIIDSSGAIGSTYTEPAMVYKIYNSDAVITLDELPVFGGNHPTPTPTPTSTPTPTVKPSPTPTPTSIPSPTPTVVPSVTPTPVPTDSFVTLTNAGDDKAFTNTISNNYKITNVSGSDIDLSKLVIRYYYTKEGSASETFQCDTAAVIMNKDPWYVSYLSSVKGTLQAMSTPKPHADSYMEIKLTTKDVLTSGSVLNINTRFNKSDWSLYDQTNDYSYKDSTHITVYYGDTLIHGTEP